MRCKDPKSKPSAIPNGEAGEIWRRRKTWPGPRRRQQHASHSPYRPLQDAKAVIRKMRTWKQRLVSLLCIASDVKSSGELEDARSGRRTFQ
ncbi:hypothetical protein BU26DRAFT_349694 [Trematosphaeria pertusa]|uniref:Uncharacterized protein n=1 Tax=Trematosphaeria pertusa TaxID=390896 RepID=A0A6A6IBE0_9PLEO|nr:uncharacterized protein BU26DRAFT_349694 [Trematosphaeria pertusa]KAF2247559.1 hypothetical protein BU26DRAFT_349694 [Trematosphaeria pertusa]